MELSPPLLLSLSLSFSASPLTPSLSHTRTHKCLKEDSAAWVNLQPTTTPRENPSFSLTDSSPLFYRSSITPISSFFSQPHYNNFLIYSKTQSQQQTHIQHTQLLWFWYMSTASTSSKGTSPCIYSAVFSPLPYLECIWQSAELITPSWPTKMAQKKNVLEGGGGEKKLKRGKDTYRGLRRGSWEW